jgi:hypothetical protein
LSEKKKDDVDQGPQGKEIFIGSTKKPSSEIEIKILDDIHKDQSIDIDVIMDMTIRQLENNKTLQTKNPDELKILRQQWKEFSTIFQRLIKSID